MIPLNSSRFAARPDQFFVPTGTLFNGLHITDISPSGAGYIGLFVHPDPAEGTNVTQTKGSQNQLVTQFNHILPASICTYVQSFMTHVDQA